MFFTRLGVVIAILALLLGASRVLIGIIIATEAVTPYGIALARYAGGASSAGEVINQGLYAIIFAVALGILTEIRRSLRDKP